MYTPLNPIIILRGNHLNNFWFLCYLVSLGVCLEFIFSRDFVGPRFSPALIPDSRKRWCTYCEYYMMLYRSTSSNPSTSKFKVSMSNKLFIYLFIHSFFFFEDCMLKIKYSMTFLVDYLDLFFPMCFYFLSCPFLLLKKKNCKNLKKCLFIITIP